MEKPVFSMEIIVQGVFFYPMEIFQTKFSPPRPYKQGLCSYPVDIQILSIFMARRVHVIG
jgi:hypothetical protein